MDRLYLNVFPSHDCVNSKSRQYRFHGKCLYHFINILILVSRPIDIYTIQMGKTVAISQLNFPDNGTIWK